ncbi:MAG: DNA mismatch repair protein MutL, partial [Prevotella sp.]
ANQFFFVNQRYMRHPYFHKAVMDTFENLVPVGEQIPYFIYFEVDPANIDVNIHPTKTEIKFENEQAIWQILSASVKESVGMFNDVPSIDFDTQGRPDIPVYNPENNVAAPKVQFNPTYNPFNTGSSSQPSTKSVDKWENLYNGLKSQRSQETELFTSKMTQPSTDIDESPVENVIAEKSPAHYQYKGCYIMTAVKSGLMIVDQHRAHVRILYDKYLEQMKDREVPSQKVLFPETIHLSATEDITLNKIEPEMVKLGFEITALGGASYAINAIPAGIEGLNVVELVHDIIVSAQEKTGDITQETNSALALTLARNAAIPFGQVLSNDEMENIFNSLFASSNPNYTPDGKNILCILKQSEIEHLLG